jgi:hypothetical protein
MVQNLAGKRQKTKNASETLALPGLHAHLPGGYYTLTALFCQG